jgi:C-terminal processing protease CtpA/Prc
VFAGWSRVLAPMLVAATLGCSSGAGSIGAVLGRDKNTGALYLRDVRRGLASDKAGLSNDDQVLMIDGVYAADLSPAEIHQKLHGDVGTTVELTIVHDGAVRRVKVVRTALVERAAKPAASSTPK